MLSLRNGLAAFGSRMRRRGTGLGLGACRALCDADAAAMPRERMVFDAVVVGAGPAGLACAIRLKQLAAETQRELSVLVIEKGAEPGAHILSGNVFEPRGLDELIPDWRVKDPPHLTPLKSDVFVFLTEKGSYKVPNWLLPPQLHNDGNYVISLSQLVRWLSARAEELGVEIYAGFPASEVLYSPQGAVRGVATKDQGWAKDGSLKDTFERGVELRSRQTVFAEGCRGSCTEEIIEKFNLRNGKDVPTYGLGIKEVWEVPQANFKSGFVMHTLGWPLQQSLLDKTFGGSFLYHMEPNLVLVGLVVGTDYENPYLNPYKEFQRWKHHPEVVKHLEGGTCIGYGARMLNEGGFHAIPKLTFPGGALVGCGAGFLNAVKIKGTHTAIKSGIMCAESLFDTLTNNDTYPQTVAEGAEVDSADGSVEYEEPQESTKYQQLFENSWVYTELREIRNTHAAFKSGLAVGMVYTGLVTHLLKGYEPWTFKNTVRDCEKTKPAASCKPIDYPKPDGKISFDLLSNLARSGTNHNHDQPSHLRVKPEQAEVPVSVSLQKYAGPETRFCPAGVYEYNEAGALVINAQNCVHCKCCSIKTPHEYIKWTVPEGGGGPKYTLM